MALKRRIKSKVSTKKSPLSEVGKTKKTKAAVSNSAGWLTTGSENIRQDIEQQKALAKRRGAPTLYFKDGETKNIRFVSGKPLGKIMQYMIKVNGKWRKFTAPVVNQKTGMMERDLFMENGYQATSKVIYEVIDRTGYLNKDGKRVKDIPLFWVVGSRIYENIEKFNDKYSDLSKFDFEVSRSGGGTDTTYTLIPEPPSPFNFGKVESLADKVIEGFAPPTLEEQQAILAALRRSPVYDDDDE